MSSGFSTASLMQNGGSYSAEGPNGFAFRLNGDQYKKADSGTKDKVASFVHRWLERGKDPAADIKGMPPLFGQDIVPHAMTFSSLIGSYAKTYLPSDESLESNPLDAILMRKDLGIMECLEIRQRMCALLDWSIVPEDDKSPAQKSLAAELTKILRRIRRFTEYRRCLMDAVWVGKSCIQHRPGYVKVGGFEYVMPKPLHDDDLGWSHIHGDKIVFRYDDGRKYDRGGYPNQMGVRVSAVMPKNARVRGMGQVEATNSGMAMFLTPAERKWVICHKHMIEDSEFANARKAGRIHGVGIRDRIYNEWFLKQETLGFLMEYLERSAGGIEIWEYPSGDNAAKASIMDAAKNRMSNGRNQLFFPKPPGMDGNPYDLRIVEPGFQGIDMLLQIQDKYFGHRIKRYIIGQTLTTEADATGLGSGVADAHKDTLSQIIRYDAHNLEETLTHETVRPIQTANWPETEGWMFNLKLELESDDSKEKMEAFQSAWQMGLGIPEKDVAELIGVSLDNPGEKVLKNQSAGAPPMAGGQFPQGAEFQSQVDAANQHVQDHGELGQAKRAVADQVKEKLGVGGENGSGGGDVQADSAGAPPSSADQYARQMSLWDEDEHPRDDDGKFVEKESVDSKSNSEPESDSGRVRMRQAKAGGEVSDVDGIFRKGGHWMPVHGLHVGKEKPEPKAKRENPFEGAGAPEVDEDGREGKGPAARRMSADQVEREKSDKADREKWMPVQSGPASEMLWIGEKPGKFGYDVKKKLVPFLSGLTNDQIERIGEFAYSAVIEADSKNYPDVSREEIEEDFAFQAESTADMLLTKKLRSQFPAMERTVEAIRQYVGLPDKLENAVALNEHMRGVLERFSVDYSTEIDGLPERTPVRSFRQPIIGGPVDPNHRPYPHPTYLSGSLNDKKMGEQFPELGALLNPDSGYSLDRLDDYEAFGIDNAVFGGKFDAQKFDNLLHRVAEGNYNGTALFAVAPDVFDKSQMKGDAKETLKRSRPWFKRIRNYGIPAAFVAQDGIEDLIDEIPWDEFDVLFLGGSDSFKLGKANGEKWNQLIDRAKDEGKTIHVGRVNSKKRYEWANKIGADSVDGTYLAFGPDKNADNLADWMESLRAQGRAAAWKPQKEMFAADPDQYQRRSSRLLELAAAETDKSPTPAQIEAGNYSKGLFSWKGLEIAIENPKGSERKGCSPSGREWSRTMASHYGYFRRTEGADGDQLDVFIGNHPDSDFVLVIKQVDQDGKFDEFKVVIGCLNRKEAKRLYLANYPAGWKCGPAAGMTVETFKKWVARGGAVKAGSVKIDSYERDFKESDHPRDDIGRFTAGEEGASFDSPELGKRNSFPMMIKSLADTHAQVGNGYFHSDVPKESLHQLYSDMTGDFSYLKKQGDSGNEFVDAVINGKGKMVGKGDDSVVFQVGDKIVKASTTVPYHPVGGGPHRTPEQAMSMAKSQFETGEKLRKMGVPGIPKTEMVKHGDKVFTVRDNLTLGTPMNREQLEQVKDSVEKLHEVGYTINDQLQVGIGPDGKAYHFDLGKAEDGYGKDKMRSEMLDVEHLWKQNGETWRPSAAQAAEDFATAKSLAEVDIRRNRPVRDAFKKRLVEALDHLNHHNAEEWWENTEWMHENNIDF
jgi:hypothetical protein